MRKLLIVAALAGLAWKLLHRGGAPVEPRATVGYADGSSLSVTPPVLDQLVQAAAKAVPA